MCKEDNLFQVSKTTVSMLKILEVIQQTNEALDQEQQKYNVYSCKVIRNI